MKNLKILIAFSLVGLFGLSSCASSGGSGCGYWSSNNKAVKSEITPSTLANPLECTNNRYKKISKA